MGEKVMVNTARGRKGLGVDRIHRHPLFSELRKSVEGI